MVAQRAKTSKERGAGGGILGSTMSPARPPAPVPFLLMDGNNQEWLEPSCIIPSRYP